MLDPIDGTVNFLHGFPLCAVSLSLCDETTVVAAVIGLYATKRGERLLAVLRSGKSVT